jgi:sulfatase maturation enzyme AslB (radical SAM superfamily)
MGVFCSLPFNSIHIDMTNRAMPCCVFRPKSKINLKDYQNSKELQEVKASFIQRKFPEQCKSCEVNEKLNNASFRMLNDLFDSDEENIRKIGVSYSNIKNVSIVTSNICNLKCMPCTMGCSYPRTEELKKLKIFPNIKPKSLIIIDETSIQEIDELIKFESMEQLTFAGGEPFIDGVTFDIIDKLIDAGLSKNIRLDINTNLTKVTAEKIEKIKENFKDVFIKGSIDGVGEVNDYLRYPSRWADILDAIKIIKGFDCEFVITTAMTNLSLIRYYELLEWSIDNGILDMFQSVVTNVPKLIPTNLPHEIKSNLLSRYLNLRKENFSEKTLLVLESCISICQSTNDYNISKTIEFLKKHDDLRKTDYSKVWPELKKYE